MKEWILTTARYFLSEWEALLVGGVVVVSAVIFLMGVLKKLVIDRISNSLVRKIVLSWSSVLLVLPVTAISVICNGFDWSNFWAIYAVNAVATIILYWLYENTAIRNALAFLGSRAVTKFISGVVTQDLTKVTTQINQEAENLLKSSNKSTSKYRDDDLKF